MYKNTLGTLRRYVKNNLYSAFAGRLGMQVFISIYPATWSVCDTQREDNMTYSTRRPFKCKWSDRDNSYTNSCRFCNKWERERERKNTTAKYMVGLARSPLSAQEVTQFWKSFSVANMFSYFPMFRRSVYRLLWMDWTLRIRAVCFCETSGENYPTARLSNNPEHVAPWFLKGHAVETKISEYFILLIDCVFHAWMGFKCVDERSDDNVYNTCQLISVNI